MTEVDTGRAIVIAACWISLTIIASVYMIVFANKLGDILFGVFLPVGLLILVGFIITIILTSSSNQEEKK